MLVVGEGGGAREDSTNNCSGGKANTDYYTDFGWRVLRGANGWGKNEEGGTRGAKSGGNGGGGSSHNGVSGSGTSGGAGGGPGYSYGGGGGGGGYEGGGGGGARNSYSSGGGAGSSRILIYPISNPNLYLWAYEDNTETTASLTIEVRILKGTSWLEWSNAETLSFDTDTKTINFRDYYPPPTLVDYTVQNPMGYWYGYFTDLPGSDLHPGATFTYEIDKDTETGALQTDNDFRIESNEDGYYIAVGLKKTDGDDDIENNMSTRTIKYRAVNDILETSEWKLLTVHLGVSNYRINGSDFIYRYKRTESNDNTVSNYLWKDNYLSKYFKVKTPFTSGGNSGYKTTINGTVYDFDDVFERI